MKTKQNKRPLDYQVLQGLCLEALEQAVKEEMQYGWIPQGGVVQNHLHQYLQAMVRDDSPLI